LSGKFPIRQEICTTNWLQLYWYRYSLLLSQVCKGDHIEDWIDIAKRCGDEEVNYFTQYGLTSGVNIIRESNVSWLCYITSNTIADQ
jgi:hypothetical protein